MEDEKTTLLHSMRTRVRPWWIHAMAGPAALTAHAPIVLVHGWGVAGGYLEPLARRLAADFPVYIPDLPGHGRSSKPGDALTLRELADVLDRWMEAIGLERAVLIGQSFGCQIAADLAARRPERALGLVLIGPTVDAAARTLPRQIGRIVRAGLFEPVSLIPIVIEDYLRMGLRRLRGELCEMFADAIERRLPAVRVPGLVIRGAHDAVVPLRWARELARLLGGAEVVTIPRGGHAVQFSEPEAVAREIRRFLGAGVASTETTAAGDQTWNGVQAPSVS